MKNSNKEFQLLFSVLQNHVGESSSKETNFPFELCKEIGSRAKDFLNSALFFDSEGSKTLTEFQKAIRAQLLRVIQYYSEFCPNYKRLKLLLDKKEEVKKPTDYGLKDSFSSFTTEVHALYLLLLGAASKNVI